MTSDLNKRGIVVNPAGTGSHVPVIERKIQEVKQRARAIINTLPYKLAINLFVFLIFFCVSRINLIPHKKGLTNLSPAEVFKGRKINFKIDLRIGFGEYVEAYDPYSDNTMRPRTQAAISLGPTGNASGSVRFLSLESGRPINRDKFTILPITDIVISRMNSLAELAAKSYKSKLDDSIDISLNPNHIDDVDDDDNNHSLQPDLLADNTITTPMDNSLDNLDEQHQPVISEVNDTTTTFDIPSVSSLSSISDELRGDTPPDIMAPSIPAISEDTHEPNHRYNTRNRPRTYWDPNTHEIVNPSDHVLLCNVSSSSAISSRSSRHNTVLNISVKKAMKSMPKHAIKSMFKELQQMVDKNVFKGVKPSYKHQKKVIKSFMFLKEKFTSDGTFDKLKSRLVAGGHMQDRDSILYEDSSSPTAIIPFLMMVAAIAAKEKRHVKTVDIGGAYLNADISDREILMELDSISAALLIEIDPSYQQYLRDNGTMVVMLNKALYGCVESSKLWYNLISSTLTASGFIINPIDPCILNKSINEIQCTIVIYVDDLFITCEDLSMIEDVEKILIDKFKDIAVHDGKIHSYLGMTWDFTAPFQVKITMEGYTNELLAHYNITGLVNTPATDNLFVSRVTTMLRDDEKAISIL